MLLDKEIDAFWKLKERGDTEKAFLFLRELLEKNPDNDRLFFLEATLYADNGNYLTAINSIDRSILISPNKAVYFFHRGCYNLKLDNVQVAERDFSQAIKVDDYGDESFTQILFFFRAEAFIKLGKIQEALSDISHIPDGYETWTFKLRSKEDLISDCGKV